MEGHGLSQADRSREAGIPVQSPSAVLDGGRRISPGVREELAGRFGVPASLFA
jgi:hypothetical protein